MGYAVLFPGQGSQHVGMGSDVFAARPDLLGAGADAILGWSLSGLCAEGPEEALRATDRAQPALFAVAYALWEAFRDAVGEEPAAAAGHSLGEYTALAAAGVIDFETGLRLVQARGEAMASAAAVRPSGMAALLGAEDAAAERLAAARREAGGHLWVANLNAPGQVVLAGGNEDLVWAGTAAREFGVRRVVPLDVAGGFHTPLMDPAAAELRGALAAVPFAPTGFPVYANATARPMADPVAALAEQLTAPVRFAETLRAMWDGGIRCFVHVGPGDVTAGMVRRTVPEAEVAIVNRLEAVAAAADAVTRDGTGERP